MRKAGRAVLAVGLVVIGSVAGVASVCGQNAASASAPTTSEAELQALKERAAKYWAARVAGDIETQWQLLEPRWKGRLTPAEYGSDLAGGRWLAYEIGDVTVNGLFATVKVRLLVQQMLPPSAASRVRPRPVAAVEGDGWIRINGLWYRRLNPEEPTPWRKTP